MQLCKCGCGELVPTGRVFLNKLHQSNWRKQERDRKSKEKVGPSVSRVELQPNQQPQTTMSLTNDDARISDIEKEYRLSAWSDFIAEVIVHIGGAAAVSYITIVMLGRFALPALPLAPWVIGILGVWIAVKSASAMLNPDAYSSREFRVNMGRLGNLPQAPIVYFLSRGIVSGTLIYTAFRWSSSV